MATEIISKRCSQCKQNKPLSEFSKSQSKKDGLRSWCKSCEKAYQQSERGKAAHRKGTAKYQQTPEGKATNRKASTKYQKTPNGKAVHRKALAKYYARNPNYIKAKNAVNNAIKVGRLPRPDSLQCHYCFRDAQQYHHWRGYESEHWLDVVPACVECHSKCKREIA